MHGYTRFRRATHVTPKSYLNFIGGYKNIYQQKQHELGEGAHRMDTGLAKLEEASHSVEILKQDLAIMEQELAQASQKAETVSNYKFGEKTWNVLRFNCRFCILEQRFF